MEKKSNEPLSDVKCEVDCCCYNTCDGKCTADKIKVTPRGTFGTEGTDCATFTERV